MSHLPRLARFSSEVLLLTLMVLLGGCKYEQEPVRPSIEITRIPPAVEGGPDQMTTIGGRVKGAAPGQQIVIYARNRVWWVQPFKSRPFTTIQQDLSWSASTHLGEEYAALLVDSGYRPESLLDSLPEIGHGGVAAIEVIKGGPAIPTNPKMIRFSGYDWIIRAGASERGGEMNTYDPSNAWVDGRGFLHLRVGMVGGRWSCAEVGLTRSLGYGTYKFTVQDSHHLDPSAVLGMFTLDERRSDDVRKELDIELSRWGQPDDKNAQYVVQPYYVPENISRFQVGAGEFTHVLRWEPGIASFASYRGSITGPRIKASYEHVFTSGVPSAAAETVHIDLYDFYHSRRQSSLPAEVVIEKFEYLP